MDSIKQNNTFKYGSYGHFMSDASQMDTKALLRQGKMNVDGVNYKVSLAANDKIAVTRDQQAQSKAKRFFSGASDLFKHRIMDDASTSRSDRMADALNYRRSVENKLTARTTSPSAQPQTSGNQGSPQTATNKQQPLLGLDHFMESERQRASYHNESPSTELAEQAYDAYLSKHQPSSNRSKNERPTKLSHSKSDPTPNRGENKLDFDHFMEAEKGRAQYFNESPSESRAREEFKQYQTSHEAEARTKDYMQSLRMNRRPSAGHNSIPTSYESELQSARKEQEAADYYGNSPNLDGRQKRILETDSYRARPQMSPSNEPGVRRTQSAPPPSQGPSSSRGNTGTRPGTRRTQSAPTTPQNPTAPTGNPTNRPEARRTQAAQPSFQRPTVNLGKPTGELGARRAQWAPTTPQRPTANLGSPMNGPSARRTQSAPTTPQRPTANTGSPDHRPISNSVKMRKSISLNISRLPVDEMTMPVRTMVAYDKVSPTLSEKNKNEILSYAQDLMSLPATQRDEKLSKLQNLLRNI